MEVHHHPHVEKKNFKEYLLEGLMIFLAVSMGFIAESIRENITKHEREHHLMEMLVEDLKAVFSHQAGSLPGYCRQNFKGTVLDRMVADNSSSDCVADYSAK